MDSSPLHPNLARIAAAYDEAMRLLDVGQIDTAAAMSRINSLHARDDEGVVWSISPSDGSWRRRTLAGEWVTGQPPASGVATLTAHDLSRDPTKFNPDSNIVFSAAAVESDGLRGSVRGSLIVDAPPQLRPHVVAAVVISIVAAVSIAAAAMAGFGRFIDTASEQGGISDHMDAVGDDDAVVTVPGP
jgi:hypothetical protein